MASRAGRWLEVEVDGESLGLMLGSRKGLVRIVEPDVENVQGAVERGSCMGRGSNSELGQM